MFRPQLLLYRVDVGGTGRVWRIVQSGVGVRFILLGLVTGRARPESIQYPFQPLHFSVPFGFSSGAHFVWNWRRAAKASGRSNCPCRSTGGNAGKPARCPDQSIRGETRDFIRHRCSRLLPCCSNVTARQGCRRPRHLATENRTKSFPIMDSDPRSRPMLKLATSRKEDFAPTRNKNARGWIPV
ncbi:hypothetical protein CDAR_373671 [Caerostris darwini]|uniref:Uncharacterized protein n=1 Tax=Caerostris darwini TaxID=1538125 RepID=A0AAV4QHY9_9ARAC|nr:hypothetical protein CDAR_373671 [Caerostris darwini]